MNIQTECEKCHDPFGIEDELDCHQVILDGVFKVVDGGLTHYLCMQCHERWMGMVEKSPGFDFRHYLGGSYD